MSLVTLTEAIRKELSTLGMPTVLEMAVLSNSGKVLYSDLSKLAMNKISPFYESLQLMGTGDDLSLALDDTRTIVASRVSDKAILIVITDKKVGIILTKMGGVGDKFGDLLDEIVMSEESKTGEIPISPEAKTEPQPVSPPVATSPSMVPPEARKEKTVTPPRVTRPEVSAPPGAEAKVPERVIVPFLNDVRILERCPEKDRKFLEMFDGTLSLRAISKKLGVPFFDVLQIATKYKNMGKVDMKEIIRG